MRAIASGVLLFAALAMSVGAADTPGRSGSVAHVTHEFRIKGMHCEGCAKGIAGELKAVKGVVRVQVSYPKQRALVACDTNLVQVATMIRVIQEAGYEAELIQVRRRRP